MQFDGYMRIEYCIQENVEVDKFMLQIQYCHFITKDHQSFEFLWISLSSMLHK